MSKGKAQKKPLELLKALIAHGGRNVDATMLTGLVWPDAEGDDAKTSFDSNLYRLRKLLDVDGALLLADGKLSLNRRARLARHVGVRGGARRRPRRRRARAVSRPVPRARCARAVDAAARDRLQTRLVRAVLAAGDALERARDWPRARSLYERTLEVDNLAEAVYRRLMVCQREEGNPPAR